MGAPRYLRLVVLGGSLAFGWSAGAETKRADRPDGGVPLLESASPVPRAPTTGSESQPGTPAPRALDSTRTPMPDREALPQDLHDARLAPPTPPVPQTGSGTKTGGGPARVKDIFRGPQGGAAARPPQPLDSVTRTPEDQPAPAPR